MFLLLVEAFKISRWKSMRVVVKSFGCSTNYADGSVLAGCLSEAGYEIVDSVSSSDVVVYNTCAVKGPTEDRMLALAERVPAEKKLIIVGCLPLINRERIEKEVRFDGLAGPAIGEKIVAIVNSVAKGGKVLAVEERLVDKPGLALPRLDSSHVVSVVPICYGCLGSCAYCCVVFARGRLRSYSVDQVVSRIKGDVNRGFREFWLTAQDTVSYGRDIGANLAVLLDSVCLVDGNFRVRVGMMTPNMAHGILNDLTSAYRDEKVYKFIHLPVQSGDDGLLKQMRRLYTADDFRKVVSTFRLYYPRITVSTDIICGFPGETAEAFQRTLDLIDETRPDVVNVSKFFPRPRTTAAKMQDKSVALSEIKKRSGEAQRSVRRIAIEKNMEWVGWRGQVLVDEVGKVGDSWIGRNFAYKPIVLKSTKDLLGKTLTVEVARAFPTFLEGRTIE